MSYLFWMRLGAHNFVFVFDILYEFSTSNGWFFVGGAQRPRDSKQTNWFHSSMDYMRSVIWEIPFSTFFVIIFSFGDIEYLSVTPESGSIFLKFYTNIVHLHNFDNNPSLVLWVSENLYRTYVSEDLEIDFCIHFIVYHAFPSCL